MTKLIPIALMFNVVTAPAEVLTGYVSAYDETPTLATIAYQQERGRIPLDLSPYDGVIAVLNCERVGHEAWLGDLYVMVFDCANHHVTKGGAWWMLDGPFIAEVGYGIRQEFPDIVHSWSELHYADGLQYEDRCAWLIPKTKSSDRPKSWSKSQKPPRIEVCYDH